MQHINWAVLGCGDIAKAFMQSIKEVSNASVVACAASHIDRANTFAATHNIPQHFGNYVSMLQERSVNAVYIATTHNFHFEHIKLCLQHGKHVLCEKPLTLNAKQAEEVYTLAANNNLLLVEAVWTRFLPAILAMKKAIQDGVIGNVKAVQANFSLNQELPDTHRLKNKKLAGGALLDLGIYPITIADIVFNKMPSRIISSAQMIPTGVDQNSFYTLEYENGAVAQLSAGFRLNGPTYALIMGDKGSINVPFFLGAKGYELNVDGKDTEYFNYDFPESNNFTFEIQHVTDCLLAHSIESDLMPSSNTIRVMQIMDTIRSQWGLHYPDED